MTTSELYKYRYQVVEGLFSDWIFALAPVETGPWETTEPGNEFNIKVFLPGETPDSESVTGSFGVRFKENSSVPETAWSLDSKGNTNGHCDNFDGIVRHAQEAEDVLV